MSKNTDADCNRRTIRYAAGGDIHPAGINRRAVRYTAGGD
jgi:hypothetical protein